MLESESCFTPLASESSAEQKVFENLLRPASLKEYVGQEEIKRNLSVFIQAAKERKEPLDHLLFYGPPGMGKTTLALLLAEEMGSNIRVTSGPALEKTGDLAAILSNLEAGDILFIDEIHRLRLPVEEILYAAMEDFSLDIVLGKGPSARSMRLSLPPFTLVGATTQLSKVSSPLLSRFGHVEKLRDYDISEMKTILFRSAERLGVLLEPEAAAMLAEVSRATPRIANRLLKRMRDFAQVLHEGVITRKVVQEGLKKLSIDEAGLGFSDRHYLEVLCNVFQGGPVGLSTLSVALQEDPHTLEFVVEPFLIQKGFVKKTPKGRVATRRAVEHLAKKGKKKEGEERKKS